jgi:hypothetical protein
VYHQSRARHVELVNYVRLVDPEGGKVSNVVNNVGAELTCTLTMLNLDFSISTTRKALFFASSVGTREARAEMKERKSAADRATNPIQPR